MYARIRTRKSFPSGGARWRTGGMELSRFFIRIKTASSQKAHALRRLRREAGATSGNNVDDKLCMLPIVELRRAHVELAASDLAKQNVLWADAEIADRIAHRRRAVAAAARLMEQQVTMLRLQPAYDLDRFLG